MAQQLQTFAKNFFSRELQYDVDVHAFVTVFSC